MIQLLILYYLNIKATHGYEIQKFIKHNHMEEWNNIKSGSIYYAMNKLEKEGLIELIEKIGNKEKSKRIYSITEKGRKELKKMASVELEKPLNDVFSEKFLIYPIIDSIQKEELIKKIEIHIKILEEKLVRIDYWYEIKENEAKNVEKATFELMKNTLISQIKWHKVLINNIDETIEMSNDITKLIKNVDFSI